MYILKENLNRKPNRCLTLKGPGFFGLSQVRPPPPPDLGRGEMKNSEIWHVRRVSQYQRADEISILIIKAFLNYANLCLFICMFSYF